jgi:hypothetical protein
MKLDELVEDITAMDANKNSKDDTLTPSTFNYVNN